ncbi:hypothetical protein [Streptomyces sp. NPDC058657]|uniref:hypothetical protein n=1 Tax=unclassified Streptomyces TaxID=2593676 RepID=UPI0036504C36
MPKRRTSASGARLPLGRLALLLALLLAVTACTGSRPGTDLPPLTPTPIHIPPMPTSSPTVRPGDKHAMVGILWFVREVVSPEGDHSPIYEDNYFYIENDDSVHGNFGCQDFVGQVRWTNPGTLRFSDFTPAPGSSPAPCEPEVRQEYKELSRLLTSADLTYDKGGYFERRLPGRHPDLYDSIDLATMPAPPGFLWERDWSITEMTTAFKGERWAQYAASRAGVRPWIRFRKDGLVEGDTGCSAFRGTYGKNYSDSLWIRNVRRERGPCGAEPGSYRAKFDAAFFRTINNGFRWRFNEKRHFLYLRDSDRTVNMRARG